MAYCSVCKEELEEKVCNYSIEHFGKALCRKHQKSNKNNEGLTGMESRYKEGLIKGRIAESLIEELFLALGYNVFRYGMENTVPGIMELLKGVKSDVAMNIRRMPDFVIQHPHRKDVFFVEVKFRANEEFSRKDLAKDYPFENCYFIIVSKRHIKCISYEELEKGKEINPKSQNYLGSRREFELDKDVIIKFCEFAVKFFKDV
ncbi:hypothetical protein COU58_02555 [Candidatus Pacearchaeota archaeon CG10_big_fil_rev_8_21_14_0_10_32_42]|nr:MAG: hypothetical protein COU58_02555 [Candidatus Pacearchaeota archaeon CG10_big_fil_rev_8_21_14_0_10_32_42]